MNLKGAKRLDELRPETFLSYSVPASGITHVCIREGGEQNWYEAVDAAGNTVRFQQVVQFLKDQSVQSALRYAEEMATKKERERCAKIADDQAEAERDKCLDWDGSDACEKIAQRIREG